MRYTLPLRLAPVLAALLAGCAAPVAPAPEDDPAIREAATPAESRRDLTVAVAPLAVAFDPEERNRERDPATFTPEVDPAALRQEMVSILSEFGAFRTVESLPPQGAEDALGDAWGRRADLLLALTLTRYETSFEGASSAGLYALNLLNWALWVWPAWFVRDESYAARLEVEATLTSVDSGEVVYRATVQGEAEQDLDDFDRGFTVMGTLTVPDSLTAENWRYVHDIVMPFARHDLLAHLLTSLGPTLASEVGPEAFDERTRKVLGLAVGVAAHRDATMPEVPHAAEDARAFSEHLSRSDGGLGAPPRNVVTLADHEATREAILQALTEHVAARAHPGDTVFIYFAGFGAVGSPPEEEVGTPILYLIPYDADPRDLATTAVSLDEVRRILEPCRPRDLVIVLDASFAGPFGTRTLATGAVATPDAIAGALTALAEGEGRAVLAASGPGEGASPFEERERGLFTYFLIEGARAEGPGLHGRPSMTLAEAFEYAGRQTSVHAALEGSRQRPACYGTIRPDLLLGRRETVSAAAPFPPADRDAMTASLTRTLPAGHSRGRMPRLWVPPSPGGRGERAGMGSHVGRDRP